jgi:hypothetical protein
MSNYGRAPLKPNPDRPGSGPHTDPINDGIAALSDLTATCIEIDGQIQVAESTWVIYGHTAYDGEIIVGEYRDAVEASAVLRAVPFDRPDHDRPLR